ncbi:hypothetical protein [Roseomonas chloroacetimidivorans]|uniref:hypothetical protein n=1 Tax=Roseomonas chloroacetimidivorans TaxID=1766656 RepID=UPI003C7190DC
MQSRPIAEPSAGKTADPFDLWLRRTLHDTWDAAVTERLPDDLLRLVSDNRSEWELMKERWQRPTQRRSDS